MAVSGWFPGLEVGVDEADVVAEAKRVSIVTLPLMGVGAGEAEGISFENNLSKSDTAPLVAVVGGWLAPLCCERDAEEASTGDVALASWGPTSVDVECCSRGGGRSKLYGYGSPLRMKDINLEGRRRSIQFGGFKKKKKTVGGELASLWYPTTVRVVRSRSPKTRT